MRLMASLVLAFWFSVAVIPAAAQPAVQERDVGLKIVVIAGEGAVNIIQQKTAVAPVVEVRDRNNLPVPGAVVTFSVGGNSASFAGAQTLSITTNAAGRAAAASFSPLTSGSVQIQVSAAFQGQTAAATIAQTNVMTAAQAAGAAGATSGSGAGGGSGGASAGAAGGGGGGLSGTTIGIIGAAVGGGALAATQLEGVLGGGDDKGTPFTGPISGQILISTTSSGPNPSVCVSTRAISATLTIRLVQGSDGAVSGTAKSEGTYSEVARSAACTGSFGTVPFNHDATVSGTASNITYVVRGSSSSTTPATVTITTEVTFAGALSGGVITGTLTYSDTGVGQNAGGSFGSSGSTTIPVTLRSGG